MYTDALFRLTALESPSTSEIEAIELLTVLVERYEQQHYSIPDADPVTVVRFLVEQQNLTERDLIPQFGSESAVSMFMTGQCNLTVEQVRRLRLGSNFPLTFSSSKCPARTAQSDRRIVKQVPSAEWFRLVSFVLSRHLSVACAHRFFSPACSDKATSQMHACFVSGIRTVGFNL